MSYAEQNSAPVPARAAKSAHLSVNLAALRARTAGQPLTLDELERGIKGRG